MCRINEADGERSRKHEIREQQRARAHTHAHVRTRRHMYSRDSILLAKVLRSLDLHRYCSEHRYPAFGAKSLFADFDITTKIIFPSKRNNMCVRVNESYAQRVLKSEFAKGGHRAIFSRTSLCALPLSPNDQRIVVRNV